VRRVVLVEDRETTRAMVEETLRRRGLAVASAGTVAEGRALLDEERPGLLLTDLQLPDGSGLELLQTCREHHPNVEVIVLTGYPTLESAIDALRLGAFDYIIKPVRDLDLVSQKVRRALERRHLRAQSRELAGQLADALDKLETSLKDATEALGSEEVEAAKEHVDSAMRATRKARNIQSSLRSDKNQ